MEYPQEGATYGSESTSPSSVWLRLVRGESTQPVWMAGGEDDDATWRVGASSDCDWQVCGDQVAPVAFYLRVISGELFVRASGACEVLLDEQRLGAMWTPADKGARLSLGSALIEVGLSGRSRSAQSASLTSAGHSELDWDEIAVRESLFPDACSSLTQGLSLRGVSSSPALRAALQTDDAAETSPLYGFGAHLVAERASFGHVPTSPAPIVCDEAELAVATILESDEPQPGIAQKPLASTGIWIAGSLVACAYGCWVLLLDYL